MRFGRFGALSFVTVVLLATFMHPEAIGAEAAEGPASQRSPATTRRTALSEGDAQAITGAVSRWAPNAQVSLAVGNPDGTAIGVEANRRFVSASSAKLYWVVAAVAFAGVEAVEPYAEPIFGESDNIASGAVIDLAGGVDAVNQFLRDRAALGNTALMRWNHGGERYSSEYPGALDGDNYTTTADAVSFLTQLANGELLAPEATRAVLSWLQMTPREQDGLTPLGGLLPDLFPDGAQQGAMHKGGWLPPGVFEEDAGLLVDIGIVPLADGSWYAVAIQIAGGDDFLRQAQYVAWASCEVYVRMSGTVRVSLGNDDETRCNMYQAALHWERSVSGLVKGQR